MRTSIVAIGNSRGVRIPKSVLQQCNFETDAELLVENGNVVIMPVRRKPREGWEESFKAMASAGDDSMVISEKIDSAEDWQW